MKRQLPQRQAKGKPSPRKYDKTKGRDESYSLDNNFFSHSVGGFRPMSLLVLHEGPIARDVRQLSRFSTAFRKPGLDITKAGEAIADYFFFVFVIRAIRRTLFFHPSDQRAALHGTGNIVSGQIEQGGSNVKQFSPFVMPAQRTVRCGEEESAK